MSTETFPYDVFLSHSAKDKAVVRPLAERLWKDGLRNNSHYSTFNSQRACAPLNKECCFIQLRLDDASLRRRRSLEVRHRGMRKTRFLPLSTAKTLKLGLTC